LLVIIAATPVIVVLSLLLVALLMAPAMARLVAQRRFPTMERKQGGSLVGSVVWSLGSVSQCYYFGLFYCIQLQEAIQG
jgi:hypothetical protein